MIPDTSVCEAGRQTRQFAEQLYHSFERQLLSLEEPYNKELCKVSVQHITKLQNLKEIEHSRVKAYSANIQLRSSFNTLNAQLNPVCHLLALLGAHHILHVSRIKVNALHSYSGRRDSSVGIATRYGMDGPGIETLWKRDFPHPPVGLGAHPASYTMGTESFPGVKRLGRGAGRLPPSSY